MKNNPQQPESNSLAREAARLVVERNLSELADPTSVPFFQLFLDCEDPERNLTSVPDAVRASFRADDGLSEDERDEEIERQATFYLGVAIGELRERARRL